MLGLEVALLSDVGGRRSNEDACGHWHSDRHLCCVLADGAGGHGGGDVASKIAVEALLSAFAAAPSADGGALARLIERTNGELIAHRGDERRLADMHTTVVCLVIDAVDARAHWSHAGDSRLYWLRDGRVLARTADHSVVQSLVSAGMLTPEQALRHPRRSELQSALGSPADVLLVDGSGPPEAVLPGDAFLLCSDGLWEWVGDDALVHALGAAASPSDWLARLELLVRAGAAGRRGHDNFSAIAVWAVDPERESRLAALGALD